MTKKRIDFLKELKNFGITSNIPNISEINGKFLNFLIKQGKYKSGLEIGSANGYSTIWIGDAFEGNSGKLITFEIGKYAFENLSSNLENTELQNVVKSFNSDFVKFDNLKDIIIEFNKCDFLDFAFIDGRKSEYLNYFLKITPFLTDNFLVIFDDVIKYKDKMLNLYEYLEKNENFINFVIPIDGDDGIMVLTRA